MNVLEWFSVFTANSNKGNFICDGQCSIQVPTTHEGNTESLGGGTLALQVTSDGTAFETYTDADGTAAELTATGGVLPVYFAGPHTCRLSLSGSTSPDITAVIMSGNVHNASAG